MYNNISNIDIYDLNAEYCSERLGLLTLDTLAANLPKKGLLWRILSLIKRSVKYSYIKSNKCEVIPIGMTLFFAIAQNEVLCMRSIQKNLKDGYLMNDEIYENSFPIGSIYRGALKYIPYVLVKYFRCKEPYLKKAFAYTFDGFCLAIQSKMILKSYLLKLNPKQIIIANQLSVLHRSLAEVAFEIGIKTIFMQHASLSNNFPLLKNFNIAMLEGKDALEKYLNAGTINMKFYLIGMAKSDQSFYSINNSTKVRSVGICTNAMDRIDLYEQLLAKISTIEGIEKLYIRPHPSDKRNKQWKTLALKYNMKYSDANEVQSFQFLQSVDLIISGDSSIHLEAALMNITCIYYDPISANLDWYSFKKNGIVEYFNKLDEVVFRIKTSTFKRVAPSREKIKYYIDTISTKFEGKSTELAVSILNDQIGDEYFITSFDNNKNTINMIRE